MSPLIEKNTTIPTMKHETFWIPADKQTSVSIHVLQGEHRLAAQNESLGRFDLTGLPPTRRGERKVEVSLEIDHDGILYASAKDTETKKSNP